MLFEKRILQGRLFNLVSVMTLKQQHLTALALMGLLGSGSGSGAALAGDGLNRAPFISAVWEKPARGAVKKGRII